MTVDTPVWRTERGSAAVLGAVLLLHLWLYLGPFAEAALFNVDVERDLGRTLDWLEGGDYPFAGPNVSDLSVTLGSLFYLILSPVLSISADPVFVRGFFVLLATAGLLVLWLTLRRSAGSWGSLLAVTWLAATGYWYENLRQLWHSNLLPLVVTLFLLAVHRAQNVERPVGWYILGAICAAIAVQLHATMVILCVAGVVGVALDWRRLRLSGAMLTLFAGSITLTPFFVGLAYGEVERTAELERWLGYGVGSPTDALSYLAWSTIPGYGMPGYDGWLTLPWGIWTLGFIVPVLALRGGWVAARDRDRLGLTLLGLVVGGLLVQVMVFQHELSTRYLHANTIPLVALAAIGAGGLRHVSVMVTGGLVGLAIVVAGFMRDGVPGDASSRYCSLVAQTEMARYAVDVAGIHPRAAPLTTHGLTCRHRASGAQYFYRAQETPEGQPRMGTHVFFIPETVNLAPAAVEVLDRRTIGTDRRRVRAVVYRPAIDYARSFKYVERLRGMAQAAANAPAGRRSAEAGAGRGVVQAQVRAGDHTLHLRFWQGASEECAVRVSRNDGGLIRPSPVTGGSQGQQRLYALEVASHSGVQLDIQVGPCADLDALDLF